MSLEDSSSAENIDETQLLKDDDNDMSNADAVSLFNASLTQALQRQKSEILSEFQKTLSSKSTVSAEDITNISSNKHSSTACQPSTFEFKQEGTKIQFNFNTDRISGLRRIGLLLKSQSTSDIESVIKAEIETLYQRNKILKIADRHGWDTVHEYLDDPLADNVEDASKLRSAVYRATRKRTSAKPYNRGGARGAFNPRDFFRGFSQGNTRNDDFPQQHNNTQRQFNDGLCFYCKRPGHIARVCPYKQRSASKPAASGSAISHAQSS